MKRRGEMGHPIAIPTTTCCQLVVNLGSVKFILEIAHCNGIDVVWDVEEVKGKGNELVWH